MVAQNIIEFLKNIDFLASAPQKLLEQIKHDSQLVEVSAGTKILENEKPGDAMYFIVEGEVRIEKHGQALMSRSKGEYIGEIALVDGGNRSTDAVAVAERVLLLRWGKSAFQNTLINNGRIAYQVCQSFCGKIRESVDSEVALRQDLERAAQVQRAMLPAETFENRWLEISCCCIQAERVGGDYFDYLPLDENHIGLVVADVQGHGFPAALLVSMLKTRLHSQVVRERDPGKVMASLNQTLTDQVNEIRMATCIYLVLDRKTRELHFCSAGHIPQYHYRADIDELQVLSPGSFILGFQNQRKDSFQSTVRRQSLDDLLVLCTDGITEAENSEGEEFGAQRLREFIMQNKKRKPEEIRRGLLKELQCFCGVETFKDDVTLLIARLF